MYQPTSITVKQKGGGPSYEWLAEKSGEEPVVVGDFPDQGAAIAAAELLKARHLLDFEVILG